MRDVESGPKPGSTFAFRRSSYVGVMNGVTISRETILRQSRLREAERTQTGGAGSA
jgi:hypothetical protein